LLTGGQFDATLPTVGQQGWRTRIVTVEERIVALEARTDALEARIAAPRPRATTTPPRPATPPRATTPSAPATTPVSSATPRTGSPRAGSSPAGRPPVGSRLALEDALGGRLLAWVGGAAVALGVVFLPLLRQGALALLAVTVTKVFLYDWRR
jgi:uncharacterized membrane protein